MKRLIGVVAGGLLVGSVWAQTATGPLNLKLPTSTPLPPSDLPAAGSSTAVKSSASTPGVYYGDTSGKMGGTEDIVAAPTCDDATYDKAQVHGGVSTGVVSGSHIGNGVYNAGAIHVTKHYGSCDDPHGGVSFSIGVGAGSSDFHHRGH